MKGLQNLSDTKNFSNKISYLRFPTSDDSVTMYSIWFSSSPVSLTLECRVFCVRGDGVWSSW